MQLSCALEVLSPCERFCEGALQGLCCRATFVMLQTRPRAPEGMSPDADAPNGGRDAVYGLDVPLMKMVNVFKSAAQGYGTERRVILLHGPVGSSKSTIVRLLKKGIEEYSRTPEGALYTFQWVLDKKREDGTAHTEKFHSPMNEDPLLLIPEDWREKVFADLCPPDSGFKIPVVGDLCPASRLIFRELMAEYKDDFVKVM